MLYTSRLKELLLRKKLVTKKNLTLYEAAAEQEKKSLEAYILSKKIIPEEKLYAAAASHLGLPFVDLKNISVRKDILFLVPEILANSRKLVAFDRKDNIIKLATMLTPFIQTANC